MDGIDKSTTSLSSALSSKSFGAGDIYGNSAFGDNGGKNNENSTRGVNDLNSLNSASSLHGASTLHGASSLNSASSLNRANNLSGATADNFASDQSDARGASLGGDNGGGALRASQNDDTYYELLESKALYAKLHKMIKSGKWCIDFDEDYTVRRVEWSDEFRHMLGYNDEKDFPNTLGAWSCLLHPDDWATGYDSIDKTIMDKTGNTPYDVEYRLNTRDRGYRWFHSVGDIYIDERVGGTRLFGVFIDIDDQKRHDEIVRLQQAALKKAQNAEDTITYMRNQYSIIDALSNDYVSIYDVQLDKDIVDVIKLKTYVAKGVTENSKNLCYSSVIYAYATNRVHPDDRLAFMRDTSIEEVTAKLKNHDQYEITYRTLVSDGVHTFIARYIRTSLSGEPMRTIIGFRNVDMVVSKDRKHQSMKQESDALTAIHESLGSGNWSMEFDRNSKLISVNWSDKFRHMLGYSDLTDFPNELESWSDLLHEEDKAKTLNAFWATVKDKSGKKTYDVQYRLLTHRQGYRWFHAQGRLIRHTDGSSDTLYGVFMDIDDQKNKDMMLRDALLAAQNASNAKTIFLNNVSHDIRTPMNAITGFCALALQHTDDAAKVKDYLQKIQTSSNHLLSLINDVLDMSKIESGKVVIERKHASIQKLVCDVASIIQGDIAKKRLNFVADYKGIRNDSVYIDTLRLSQILLNLLGNAIKFTPSGGSVTLKVTERAAEEQLFAFFDFYVKDTGIGISKEFLPHVFESFEREQNATTSGIQGTGLGLAITKSLVDIVGGSIAIDSTKGEGTTFCITLKLRLAEPLESKTFSKNLGDTDKAFLSQAYSENVDTSQPKITKGASILLVEDNELNMEIARSLLIEAGYKCTTAQNGQEALDKVTSAPADAFSIILMDIQMPVMTGYEATTQIRALPDKNKASLPIIAMTADAFEEDKEKARLCGMNAHISKPFDPKRLFATIERLLRR